MDKRQSWNEYFMSIAELVATRSTCNRANVGAVIINEDNRIVSTGYNGSVSGTPHCDEIGHTMRDGHCIATIHAEVNALYYCAKQGISVDNCTIYITHFPCLNCIKALIQSGIKQIYYKNDYRIDDYGVELLNQSGIIFDKI
ncbi:MAG: cytidine/deoxycytidylate deaminase family protein [Romboutsia sp.]|nr:cytidine/deoxycytidylate deaminase family protein [Romboutsia sp.]